MTTMLNSARPATRRYPDQKLRLQHLRAIEAVLLQLTSVGAKMGFFG